MDCASLKAWLDTAGQVGLPLVVMSYVLVRVERSIRALALALMRDRAVPGDRAP